MAQATRTWVSGVGDDANPCSRTAPCKTFAGAISKTAAGGEIDALDPGGFGQVTITKAITLDGGGQVSSILSSFGTGITIQAGVNDLVRVRNLSISGAGGGTTGVRFVAGRGLELENVSINDMSGNCVEASLAPISTAPSGPSPFGGPVGGPSAAGPAVALQPIVLRNVKLSRCAAAGVSLSGPVSGVLDRVSVSNSGMGATAGAQTKLHLIGSTLADNSVGLAVTSANAAATISDSAVSFNITGILVSAGNATIHHNRITGNGVGLSGVGSLVSLGDNQLSMNGADGSFSTVQSLR
jgi:hypothetical protein